MYASTQTHRTPKSLFNFLMPDPLKGRLEVIADKRGTSMSNLVRLFVESGVREFDRQLDTDQKREWSIGSAKRPVTDRGEPLAIFANLPETDYENL